VSLPACSQLNIQLSVGQDLYACLPSCRLCSWFSKIRVPKQKDNRYKNAAKLKYLFVIKEVWDKQKYKTQIINEAKKLHHLHLCEIN